MNVDRLPGSTDDLRRDADTTALTDSPQPESTAPPEPEPERHRNPERAPEQERKSDQEQQPDIGQDSAGEHPPESSPTQTDSPANDTPDPAEPRSRQEHAAPTSADEHETQISGRSETSAEDEVADRDPTDAAEAGTCPDREQSPTGLDAHEETERDSVGQQPADDRSAGDSPGEKSSAGEDSGVNERLGLYDPKPSDEADLPSDKASEQRSATPAEKSPESPDDIPAPDLPPPLTDKEWSEHLTEVRDTLDKARAAGLRESSYIHYRRRSSGLVERSTRGSRHYNK